MAYARGLHPGATWRKCDFQIHTPRDRAWKGAATLPQGDNKIEAERRVWAESFAAACLQRGLDAVALTDHHDIVCVPYARTAIQENGPLESKIWLFPGVEVTCNDNVQCIVIFDRDTNQDDWLRFIHKLGKVQQSKSQERKANQAISCGKNIQDLVRIVKEDEILSKKLIVLPTAGSDHKSILNKGNHITFRELDVDGVCIGKSYRTLDKRHKEKIYGDCRPDWGDRRRGILTTSDCRSAGFDKLGANVCWVRLGEPTAESIRQAMLADRGRVAYEAPNALPLRIVELRISAQLCGESFRVVLNDGFNALIGGRGSGKSTILEYLRFGLGRSAADLYPADDSQFDRERKLTDPNGFFLDGKVDVVIARDGITETWSRSSENYDLIKIARGQEDMMINISDAQKRFPARVYYQKELSNTTEGRSSCGDLITEIAAAELLDKRHQCEVEIQAAKSAIHRALPQLFTLWLAEAELQRAEADCTDAAQRLAATQKRLRASGLSKGDQALIDEAPTYERARNYLGEVQARSESDAIRLKNLRDDLLAVPDEEWSDAEDFTVLRSLAATFKASRSRMIGALNQAIAECTLLSQSVETTQSEFQFHYEAFQRKYKKASEHQSAHAALVKDIERLHGELNQANQKHRRAKAETDRYRDTANELQRSRRRLQEATAERYKLLQRCADRVTELSRKKLRAEVRRVIGAEERRAVLDHIVEGAGLRDKKAMLSRRLDDPVLSWENTCDKLLEVLQYKTKNSDIHVLPESVENDIISAVIEANTKNQIRKIYERIDASSVIKVLQAIEDHVVRFLYHDRRYIDFDAASPGQRASVLLELLLRQNAGPLIIDQPEDDLDNRIIWILRFYYRKQSNIVRSFSRPTTPIWW